MTWASATNVAQGDAQVGVQAETVHVDQHYYQVATDADPAERFRAGVHYLDARMPAEALRFFEQAAAAGYDSHELQFHRLLAMVSGRSLRELTGDEFTRLMALCEQISSLDGRDEWTVALRTLLRQLESLESPADPAALDELDLLRPRQRELILTHLEALLDGPWRDEWWRRSVAQARAGQLARDRLDRVWKFFHPVPMPPRVRPVAPATVPVGDWLSAGLGAAAVLLGGGALGWLLLQRGDPVAVLVVLVALAGLASFSAGGADWHFRHRRMQAKDALLRPPPARPEAPAGGFARQVDRLFQRYFGRYVPDGADRDSWLAETAGIRRQLRDELVELYREQPVRADRLAWLVRHLASETSQAWQQGTLASHRHELATPWKSRVRCVGGLATAVTAGGWAVAAAVPVAPLPSIAWALLAAAGAGIGVGGYFAVTAELWRARADERERCTQLARRREAYQRWRAKLADTPTDAEIAGWLECDRRILVDEVMRHYRLRPSQVVAHAFVEAPGRAYQRARVRRGPWRYSRYRLLLFLLTDDGVRQVDLDLDFQQAARSYTQRLNYRYDAVAAVGIDGVDSRRPSLALSLVNGEPIRVPVTEPDPGKSDDGSDVADDPQVLYRVAMDASGLVHTLNILEGVAAEGKEWLRHQRHRAGDRFTELATTVRKLFG